MKSVVNFMALEPSFPVLMSLSCVRVERELDIKIPKDFHDEDCHHTGNQAAAILLASVSMQMCRGESL